MKIEDFQLSMQSKHKHKRTITTSFESNLESETIARSQDAIKAMNYEKRLTSQIHLMLIRQFLQQLYSAFRQTNMPLDLIPQPSQKEAIVTTKETEFQKFDLCMDGFIQTDTQKIAIDINVTMSHTLISERSFEASHCIDPLIINLEGEMPSLSDTSFHFDIDNDGTSDQISALNQGNGFLALDRDDNGSIDSGSELFGTTLGNGFAELSRFDDDGNMWIDENDPIFDKLRIWIKNDTQDQLIGLGEVGIGAIYLGSTRSEFRYKNQTQTLGQLRSSGLFLHEDGHGGIITQIDLAKQKHTDSTIKTHALATLLQKEV